MHPTPDSPFLNQLAQALWHARDTGGVLDSPTQAFSLDDAYAIQALTVTCSGQRQIGWKVGSTSKEAQAKLNTDEPGAGPLLDGLCFASDSEISIFPRHHVFVEAEVAVRLRRSIPSENPDHRLLSRCIDSVIPAIEVVGSRWASGLTGTGRELATADGGANVALVHGTENQQQDPLDLNAITITLQKNGESVAEGTGARALGHPLNVLQWLAGHCHQRGLTLEAGAVITTGTCTGLVAVAPGDEVLAEFNGLGAVSARFVG